MQKKMIISILLILLLLTAISTEVFASEYKLLKFGSRGNDVIKLQRELQNRGYYNYNIDGIYGKITERAVINYQIDNKLRIDGLAGKETQSKLYGSSSPSRGNGSTTAYNADDIYWLARIIHAEAGARCV